MLLNAAGGIDPAIAWLEMDRLFFLTAFIWPYVFCVRSLSIMKANKGTVKINIQIHPVYKNGHLYSGNSCSYLFIDSALQPNIESQTAAAKSYITKRYC